MAGRAANEKIRAANNYNAQKISVIIINIHPISFFRLRKLLRFVISRVGYWRGTIEREI